MNKNSILQKLYIYILYNSTHTQLAVYTVANIKLQFKQEQYKICCIGVW